MHPRTRAARLVATVSLATSVALIAAIVPAAAEQSKALPAATINGSGATFPQGYYDECRASFEKVQPNLTVNYPNPGGGSGKGRQEFADQVTQWGATDAPFPAADLAKVKGGAFLYVPTVAAPITVSYHLSGVSKPLSFSATTLARIFQGDVTSWSDPAIAADNEGVKLPSTKITVVRRSDSSGTTQNFTTYLAKAAGSVWELGAGTTISWPDRSQGGNGNAGVASVIQATDGAIGYVDYSDARATGLTYGNVENSTGRSVKPTVKAATAALEGVTLAADGLYDPLDSPNARAYPITAPTWLLVYERYDDADHAKAVRAWAEHLVGACQRSAKAIDYAPLPEDWARATRARLETIT